MTWYPVQNLPRPVLGQSGSFDCCTRPDGTKVCFQGCEQRWVDTSTAVYPPCGADGKPSGCGGVSVPPPESPVQEAPPVPATLPVPAPPAGPLPGVQVPPAGSIGPLPGAQAPSPIAPPRGPLPSQPAQGGLPAGIPGAMPGAIQTQPIQAPSETCPLGPIPLAKWVESCPAFQRSVRRR
jgi:hypothetical protein